MRKSIDTYVQGIAIDNAQHIKEDGYVSIADYIISNAENGTGWTEFSMIRNSKSLLASQRTSRLRS